MIGKRFNEWTVLIEVKSEKPGRWYECLCSCGNVRLKSGPQLRSGRGRRCSDCQYADLYNPAKEIGKKYGKWTVIKFKDVHRKLMRYETQCECGTTGMHVVADLRAGKSRQCVLCHNRENAENNKKHGLHKSPIYKVWSSMIHRCNNSKSSVYDRYGGRGIKVCERWHTFENFLADMGDKPEGLTIDRINNDGNYEPSNCRWVTHKENCQNRSYPKTRKPRTKKN